MSRPRFTGTPRLPSVGSAATWTTRAAAASLIALMCALTTSSPSIVGVSAFSSGTPGSRVVPSATSNPASAVTSNPPQRPRRQQPVGNILILDHLNINHERGRHDLVKSFYFDFLKCAVDPRKEENLVKGSKTLWANIGANQFHLPEGKPDAQVFDGVITLVYPDLDGLKSRYDDAAIQDVLGGSKFNLVESGGEDGEESLLVTDPWGTRFRIVKADDDPAADLDPRGTQKGGPSEGLALRDLTVYVPPSPTTGSTGGEVSCNFSGIARFYDQILGAPVLSCDSDSGCTISVGPRQTLTFAPHPDGPSARVSHDDLRDEGPVEGNKPHYPSNYGPHISMYVSDLRSTYAKASELGLAYVNPRFKRRAYTLEEAVDDCMFRCLDVVDPDDVDAGPILRLEHEVRSVVKRDGSKYKSCPFEEIPVGCVV